MKKDLLKRELRNLFSPGFEKSLINLNRIFNVKGDIEKISVTNLDQLYHELNLFEAKGEHIFLKTEIIGEFDGVSFLVFDKSKVEEFLLRHCTSMGIVSPLNFMDFLKEVDNILSATVISNLADELDVSIFGDAPNLSNDSLIVQYPPSKEGSDPALLTIHCKYAIQVPFKMKADFIWILKENFIRLMNQNIEYLEKK